MSTEMLTEPQTVTRVGRRELDVRGLTITTAIVSAVREERAELAVGGEVEVLTDAFPAIVTDLRAWCRTTGHELVNVLEDAETYRLRLRRGAPRPNDHRLAIVVSTDGLEQLLSPLGFALAAALGGAQVAVYLQGPAVHLLGCGFRPRLHGIARPFSRFARAGLEKAGHVSPAEKLRQLQALGAQLYACEPSLEHFGVDPKRLAFDDVIVCEYLTFTEVMQQADVQLYA